MKKTFLGLIGLIGLIGVSARADVSSQDFGVTNSWKSSTTTTANMGAVVKIDKEDNCAVVVQMQGDAAGTGAVTVTFKRSYDGTTFETTPKFTAIFALNGNTAVVGYTNLSSSVLGAAGYLAIASVQNADGSCNATNCSVLLLKKTVKPSP